MKILHTSDWHLGQRLHGRDREEEHQLFLDWLTQCLEEENCEALLVSGDIFDVGYPPNSALKQYYSFLTGLINSPCKQVIITGGNHDYISTLEAPSDVLKALNVIVIGGAKDRVEEEVVQLRNGKGEVEAVVAAVPFLRDKDTRRILVGETYDVRNKAVYQGIVRHYELVAEQMKSYEIPKIAMGHLYVQGATTSESERDIHIGNLAGFGVSSFPADFDYVALGHIHRPQKLNKTGTIRYSGSPLALSFSEHKDQKQVLVVEVKAKEIASITPVMIPQFRRLVAFAGTMDEVEELVNTYVSDSKLVDWAELRVEEAQADPAIRTRFDQFVEQVNSRSNGLEIIKPQLRFQTTDRSANQNEPLINLADLAVEQVFDKLLQEKQLSTQSTLKNTFNELLDFVHHQSEKG